MFLLSEFLEDKNGRNDTFVTPWRISKTRWVTNSFGFVQDFPNFSTESPTSWKFFNSRQIVIVGHPTIGWNSRLVSLCPHEWWTQPICLGSVLYYIEKLNFTNGLYSKACRKNLPMFKIILENSLGWILLKTGIFSLSKSDIANFCPTDATDCSLCT